MATGQQAFAQTPNITPKSNVVIKLDNTGNHTIALAEVATVANPDGSTPTQINISPVSFNCNNLGPQTVTVTATNYLGPIVTGTATKNISVTVASQPQFAAHADVTVGSDLSCSASLPDFTADAGATSCAGATLTVTQSPAVGTPMNLNVPITVTLTATDQYGGSATTSFKATYKYSPVISPLPGPVKLTLDANGNYQTKVTDVVSIVTCDNSNPTITLNPANFDCSQLGPQTVTVTATTIDAGGNVTSTASKTVNVIIAAIPVFAAHPDVTIITDANCKSIVPDFTVNPNIKACPLANLTYIQVPAAGTPLTVNVSTKITLTAIDQYGSQGSISFNVIARAKPVITPLPQPITVQLNASGTYTAKLADLATVTLCDNSTPAVTISPATIDCNKLGPQTFTITARNTANVPDINLVTTTAQVTVNVTGIVTFTSALNDVTVPISGICPTVLADYTTKASAYSSCSNNIKYTQSPAAGTIISGTAPITVTITATDEFGTVGTKSFKVIPDNSPAPPPSINITASSQNICDGATVTFRAVLANTPGLPTFQWLLNGANVGTGTDSYITSTLKNGDVVTCKMMVTTGCTVSITSNALTIKVNNNLKVDIAVSAPTLDICAGQSFTFTANYTNAGTNPTFKWTVNDIAAGTNSPTFTSSTLLNSDQVTCSVTNNDAGCFVAKTVTAAALTVKVSPVITPTVSITSSVNSTVCAGTNFTFTANTFVAAPAYQWQVNGINAGTNSFTFSSTTLKDGDAVTCIITVADKCAALKTATSNKIFTSVFNNFTLTPVISTPNVNICSGQPVTFTASAPGAPLSVVLFYKWSVNNVEVSGSNSTTFTTSALKDADVITCVVTVTNGCVGPFKSNSLTVHVPSVAFTSQPTIINKGQSITLSPVVTGNIVSYRWSPAAGLSDPTIANPVATPDGTTTYQLTVTGPTGCQATASITIPVFIPINIPNSFTPNGDGINDLWNISALSNYPNNTVDIFDRYGRALFHSAGYVKPWDGTQNGNTLPAGVYYYIIDPKNSAFKLLSGWVAIIK